MALRRWAERGHTDSLKKFEKQIKKEEAQQPDLHETEPLVHTSRKATSYHYQAEAERPIKMEFSTGTRAINIAPDLSITINRILSSEAVTE